MTKKIFIIEDEYPDFMLLKELLETEGFSVFPDTKENFDSFLSDLTSKESLNTEDTSKLEEILFSRLKQEDPGAIVCDLKLIDDDESDGSTDTFGHKIIDLIRCKYQDPNSSLQEFIPILAFSKFSMLGVKPTQKGVDFMSKLFLTSLKNSDPADFVAQKDLFIAKLNFLIDNHHRNKVLVEILKPTFNEYKRLLSEHNQMISQKIDDVEFLIKGNQSEIIKKFELIFMAIYSHFTDIQKKDFQTNFESMVDIEFGSGFLSELESLSSKDRWSQFKADLADINSAGGFEKFITGLVDMANEAKLLESVPGGKLAGIALKTIVGVLSAA